MKKIIAFLLLLTVSISFSQETTIKSEVNSATVFLNSAQVTRTKKVQLHRGVQVLKFEDLSPFVDKKSIQVKAENVEIQSIHFEKNHLAKKTKSSEQLSLENTLAEYAKQIRKEEEVNLSSIREEIQFLKENRSIGGTTQKLTVTDLQQVSQFHSIQMKSLRTKELNLKQKISKLKYEKKKVYKQLSELNSKKEFASGEIYIKIKSPAAKTTHFQLTYNVSNVGWYPSYDVRVKDINSPLILVYKANLKQNSQVDWNNVRLRFSSANPSQSNKAGKIQPYFLDYGTFPPNYKGEIDEVTGYVKDYDGSLPGVTVLVKGTTIGAETDFNGRYSIKIPNKNATLVYSYLGYKTEERLANRNSIHVTMEESSEVLDEIVVTGYGSSNASVNQVLQGRAAGVKIRGASTTRGRTKNKKINYSIPTQKIINQTSVSFEIIEPYTIKSSNKDFVISMKTYESDADYNYYAVPRIEENAFLVASLPNWEKFSLLEGEANVYFEDTFIGTTLIDTRYTEKTLEISLGMDKNVTVKRTKSKDFTTRQFIGNKQEETSVWDFIIKNNKVETINMTVLDQIPISTREEIRVTLDKLFDGKLNKETGEVKWNFIVASKKVKNIKLKYSVRFPKNYQLVID